MLDPTEEVEEEVHKCIARLASSDATENPARKFLARLA